MVYPVSGIVPGWIDLKAKYSTKDSGRREEYASGMRRDTQEGKPDFFLLMPLGLPYEEQMLTRWAELMTRGAEKYGRRNFEKAKGLEELERFKSSAIRHMYQWLTDASDEDHAAAVMFNIMAAEYTKWRIRQKDSLTPYEEILNIPTRGEVSETIISLQAEGTTLSELDFKKVKAK